MNKMKTITALSLNGGGAKGISQAAVLNQFEVFHGKIKDNFNLIYGESTGSLVGCLLALGHSAEEIISIYKKELPIIFNRKLLRLGLFRSKYGNKNLANCVKKYTKDLKFKDLEFDFRCGAVDVSNNEYVTFSKEKTPDVYLHDAVIASSSAPHYFPLWKIDGKYYKDGGMHSNNPSIKIANGFNSVDIINLLNVTCGSKKSFKEPSKNEKKGGYKGIEQTINTLLAVSDEIADKQMKFYESEKWLENYERMEVNVIYSSGLIDDVSIENIHCMVIDGFNSYDKKKSYEFMENIK